jgi:hypothetical protein
MCTTPKEKAARAKEILNIVDADVRHAIKLEAMFVRVAYTKHAGKKFDQTMAAQGYNTVLDSLYFELVLTMTRIYDKIRVPRVAENTASLPQLMKLLSQPEVVQEIQDANAAARTPTGDFKQILDGMGSQYYQQHADEAMKSAAKDAEEIRTLVTEFEVLQGNHLLGRLETIRDELFAHKAIVRNFNNPAKYGDAEELLVKTCSFVTRLNKAVIRLVSTYEHTQATWQEHAESFWKMSADVSNGG